MKTNKSIIAFVVTVLFNFNAFASSDNIANKVGSTIRGTIGELADGFMTKGDERDLLIVELTTNPNLQHLTITNAKPASFFDVGLKNGITCYIVSDTAFNGKLVAKAYDKEGKELGSSEQIVFLDQNKGKELIFDFPRALKTHLVDKYVIDYQTNDIVVDISPEIESKLGLRFIKIDLPKNNELQAYIIADKQMNTRLIVKAFNHDGIEVNREAKTIWFKDNTATEVTFKFHDIAKINHYAIEIAEQSAIPIEYSASINDAGLTITRTTENQAKNSALTLISYIIANKDFNGRLIAKAIDSKGIEIGRGNITLTLTEDDAQESLFTFPQGMNIDHVAKIVIGAKIKE